MRDGLRTSYAQNGGWLATPDSDARFGADDPNGGFFVVDDAATSALPGTTWLYSLVSLVLLAGVLFVIAVRRLRLPAELER